MNVFFLHGPAAAGKYTVGRRLADELGVPLFHNHLTVDLATSLFDFGTPGFVELRERTWVTSFEVAAQEARSFVFTFQPESTVREEFVPAVIRAVEARGGKIHFVELVCADEIAESRVTNESRAAFGKLRDVAFYRQLRDSGAFDFGPMPTASARVDTGTLSPDEALNSILEQLRAKGVRARVMDVRESGSDDFAVPADDKNLGKGEASGS